MTALLNLLLPRKEIQGAWTKNKAVVTLVWANGTWYALTHQVHSLLLRLFYDILTSLLLQKEGVPGQGFYANSDWPMEKIQENMKNKKYVQALAWDPKEEFWVFVFGPMEGGMRLATTENFPTEKLKEVPNLFMYGKRD